MSSSMMWRTEDIGAGEATGIPVQRMAGAGTLSANAMVIPAPVQNWSTAADLAGEGETVGIGSWHPSATRTTLDGGGTLLCNPHIIPPSLPWARAGRGGALARTGGDVASPTNRRYSGQAGERELA